MLIRAFCTPLRVGIVLGWVVFVLRDHVAGIARNKPPPVNLLCLLIIIKFGLP